MAFIYFFAVKLFNITTIKSHFISCVCSLFFSACLSAQPQINKSIQLIPVDSAWANNTVNVTVFRKNSLVTYKDTQYIAYYNKDAFVVVGKRKIGTTQWQLNQTPYKGNAADAHNVISIMTDGDGYLHLAWDHHNNALHYCRSVQPGALVFTQPMPMTGMHEDKVSYPEFYKMPDGNLLFFYRDGGSGQGNLVINKYDVKQKQWTQLQSNLIDGEGQRNAYWQACVDKGGTIHISWVWRETPDVASNHDMCYACSKDGGVTWQKSTGEKYTLPITAATAEYAVHIPQNSELINQTSMFADENGYPYIATYWRDAGTTIPQYHIVYNNNHHWQTQPLNFRKTSFSLSGMGTKKIPVSRPQIIAWQNGKQTSAAIIFRDEERGSKVSMAICKNLNNQQWQVFDLTTFSVQSWEPTYDTELWKEQKILHLFVEKTVQVDAEGKADIPPQLVQVLEWKP